jgi:hypothetical protein
MKKTLHSRLRHHVTGAIERGEAQAIVEIPALHKGPFPLHITQNEDNFVIVTSQGNHYAKTFDPSAARLISSAPEMLQVLESCLDYLLMDSMIEEDAAPEIESIRKAIAKAKGEA